MNFTGIDLAAPSGDRSVVITPYPHGWRKGETFRATDWPRSRCAFVKSIISETAFECGSYMRPSKGYRKYIRRAKARAT